MRTSSPPATTAAPSAFEECADPRSLLTVEPLRYALALKPRWIALEQVPAVLELWTIFAGLLAAEGYHTAAGVLSAERYGVPQTRKRAFLIASLDGPVELPAGDAPLLPAPAQRHTGGGAWPSAVGEHGPSTRLEHRRSSRVPRRNDTPSDQPLRATPGPTASATEGRAVTQHRR